MTQSQLLVGLVCAAAGALAGARTPTWVRRLPEPAALPDEPPPNEPKPAYAELADAPELPAVAIPVAALGCGLIGVRVGPQPELPALVYLWLAGVVLGYLDLRVRLLPNAIVLPSYVVVAALLLLAAALSGSSATALATAAVGGAVLWAAFFALMLGYPAGMGFGDVKLAGLLGLGLGWLGLGHVLVGVFAAFVFGGIAGLGLLAARRVHRKAAIPFGPFLVLGYLAAVLVGHDLIGWYLGTAL